LQRADDALFGPHPLIEEGEQRGKKATRPRSFTSKITARTGSFTHITGSDGSFNIFHGTMTRMQ
jgi:hypothetical protein